MDQSQLAATRATSQAREKVKYHLMHIEKHKGQLQLFTVAYTSPLQSKSNVSKIYICNLKANSHHFT